MTPSLTHSLARSHTRALALQLASAAEELAKRKGTLARGVAVGRMACPAGEQLSSCPVQAVLPVVRSSFDGCSCCTSRCVISCKRDLISAFLRLSIPSRCPHNHFFIHSSLPSPHASSHCTIHHLNTSPCPLHQLILWPLKLTTSFVAAHRVTFCGRSHYPPGGAGAVSCVGWRACAGTRGEAGGARGSCWCS